MWTWSREASGHEWAAVGLFPGSCQRGGACTCVLTHVAPTLCNSNSMWKCPLVPVGLLLSGVEAGTCRGRGATATQHARRSLHSVFRLGKATDGGLSTGCQDGVHRALTYELTASTLFSPLAANSIGHRYVHLNASHNNSKEQGGSQGGRGYQSQGPSSFFTLPLSYSQLWNPAWLPYRTPVCSLPRFFFDCWQEHPVQSGLAWNLSLPA